MFYYSGHGIQVKGVNYLVPVDFHAQDEAEVEDNGYPADMVEVYGVDLQGNQGAPSTRQVIVR